MPMLQCINPGLVLSLCGTMYPPGSISRNLTVPSELEPPRDCAWKFCSTKRLVAGHRSATGIQVLLCAPVTC